MKPRFDGSITWVGHGTFLLQAGTARVLIDAFIDNCPTTPAALHGAGLGDIDLILLTHGHEDHVADVVAHQQRTGAVIATTPEVAAWVKAQGVEHDQVIDFNKGGTIHQHGLAITMVRAEHTSSMPDGSYGGEPVGYVIECPGGFTIYAAGDTTVFSDMQLIRDLHAPELAILPVGDHYTMAPELAKTAVELLEVRQVLCGHWGTFPPLVGRPQRLRELVGTHGVHVHDVEPGGVVTGDAINAAVRD